MAAIAFWRTIQYTAQGDYLDESGNGHAAVFSGPAFHPYDGMNYLRLNAVNADYADTADAAALDITGDIDARCWCALDDWTPSTINGLIGKGVYNNQRSWRTYIRTDGTIGLQWSENGSSWLAGQWSTEAVDFTDGTPHWVRSTLDVDNGAGVYEVRHYTSDNGQHWVQLGSTITGGSTTNIYSSSAQLELGRVAITGGGYLPMAGKIMRAQVYDGIEGTLVFDADFSVAIEPFATFAESSAQAATVTMQGDSFVISRDEMRLDGASYFEVADHADLDFATSDSFTIAACVRVPDVTPAAAAVLIGKKDDLTTAIGPSLYLDTDSKVKFVIDDGTNPPVTAESTAISAGLAVTAAGVRDATGNTLQVFINGVASGSSVADTTTGTLANARPLRIGANSAATPGSFLTGNLIGAAGFQSALNAADNLTLDKELRLNLAAQEFVVTTVGLGAEGQGAVLIVKKTSKAVAGTAVGSAALATEKTAAGVPAVGRRRRTVLGYVGFMLRGLR
jgi:hypothetical protein